MAHANSSLTSAEVTMSYGRPQKLCRHWQSCAAKQFEKRRVHRLRRQKERIDPEDAPKKTRYLGYGD